MTQQVIPEMIEGLRTELFYRPGDEALAAARIASRWYRRTRALST